MRAPLAPNPLPPAAASRAWSARGALAHAPMAPPRRSRCGHAAPGAVPYAARGARRPRRSSLPPLRGSRRSAPGARGAPAHRAHTPGIRYGRARAPRRLSRRVRRREVAASRTTAHAPGASPPPFVAAPPPWLKSRAASRRQPPPAPQKVRAREDLDNRKARGRERCARAVDGGGSPARGARAAGAARAASDARDPFPLTPTHATSAAAGCPAPLPRAAPGGRAVAPHTRARSPSPPPPPGRAPRPCGDEIIPLPSLSHPRATPNPSQIRAFRKQKDQKDVKGHKKKPWRRRKKLTPQNTRTSQPRRRRERTRARVRNPPPPPKWIPFLLGFR